MIFMSELVVAHARANGLIFALANDDELIIKGGQLKVDCWIPTLKRYKYKIIDLLRAESNID